MTVASAIDRLLDRQQLSGDEAFAVAGEMLSGNVPPAQVGALLALLRAGGETADVIYGFARALRAQMQPVDAGCDGLVDTCGTGGDGRGTFNVSTVSALVAAGAGCRVAKHGNRRVSSRCGSADVLEALGVRIDLSAADSAEQLRSTGITFLYAPHFHPGLQRLAPLRRQLGFRTVFNLVGPLANPAGVKRQVVGVFDGALIHPVAEALRRLGAEHALIVHGTDGGDEISIVGPTCICELKNGTMIDFEVRPEQFDLPRGESERISGGTAAENAAIAVRILSGERSPARDIVLLNAGAAIYVAGLAASLGDGIRMADRSIDDGSALARLERLRQYRGAGI